MQAGFVQPKSQPMLDLDTRLVDVRRKIRSLHHQNLSTEDTANRKKPLTAEHHEIAVAMKQLHQQETSERQQAQQQAQPQTTGFRRRSGAANFHQNQMQTGFVQPKSQPMLDLYTRLDDVKRRIRALQHQNLSTEEIANRKKPLTAEYIGITDAMQQLHQQETSEMQQAQPPPTTNVRPRRLRRGSAISPPETKEQPLPYSTMTLSQILQQRTYESKQKNPHFLREVLYTTLTEAKVPPGVQGVPVAEELRKLSIPGPLSEMVMDFAGLTGTLEGVAEHLIPAAKERALFLLRETIADLEAPTGDFLTACREAHTETADLDALANSSEYENFLQVNGQLVGNGFEAVNIDFDAFARDVLTRFDAYSVTRLMGGSMRVLPSACAFSSTDLANIPQVALSSVLVLWSLGMNAPVVLLRPSPVVPAMLILSTHWADGRRVTKQDYDREIYNKMVRPLQEVASSRGHSSMQMDTSANTAVYSSTIERVQAVNKELRNSLPVGLCHVLDPKTQTIVCYNVQQKEYYDKVVVQVSDTGSFIQTLSYDHGKTCGLHSSDEDNNQTDVDGAYIQDVIVTPKKGLTNHSFSASFNLNVITDKNSQERCFIVNTEKSNEFNNYKANVEKSSNMAGNHKATDEDKKTRDLLFALPSSKEVVHYTTEAFANQGVVTVLGCSCVAWKGCMIVVSRLAPLYQRFTANQGSPQNFAEWAKVNLAPTEEDKTYYDKLVEKKEQPKECPFTAEELEGMHGNLIVNMSEMLKKHTPEAKEKVLESFRALDGVIPTPPTKTTEWTSWTSAGVFTSKGLTPKILETFQNEQTSLALERRGVLQRLVDQFKNSILNSAPSSDGMTASDANVGDTNAVSASKRYTKRRKTKK
jgi:hypothetical protein